MFNFLLIQINEGVLNGPLYKIIIIVVVVHHKAEAPSTLPSTTPVATQPAAPTTPSLSDALGISAADSSGWKTYTGSLPFSISYPQDWIVNQSYQNTTLGPNKTLDGVGFAVPQAFVTGTNLSSDSSISVENNTTSTDCDASEFLDDAVPAGSKTITINGQTWSLATGSDAGAGNRYQETVVSFPHSVTPTDPCLGIRLFLHYGALENYPTGTVKAFDQDAITRIYESMVNSFIQHQ